MTSSVRLWKAVVSQFTVPLESGGCTDWPVVWRVTFSPFKNCENSDPSLSKSLPLWGTIRPLRWVAVSELAASDRLGTERAGSFIVIDCASLSFDKCTYDRREFPGRTTGMWQFQDQFQPLLKFQIMNAWSKDGQDQLTSRWRNVSTSLNVNTSCRIVRWQLEVVNGDSRNSIECLKCYDFGERDVVEDCSEGRHPKFGSRYRPIKTGIVQQKGGKFGEADNHGQ